MNNASPELQRYLEQLAHQEGASHARILNPDTNHTAAIVYKPSSSGMGYASAKVQDCGGIFRRSRWGGHVQNVPHLARRIVAHRFA